MRFDVPSFIREYSEAATAGLTLAEIAEVMGMKASVVGQRANALTKRGIVLPPRKHALKGKTGRPSPLKGRKIGPRKQRKGRGQQRKAAQFIPAATVATGFVIHVSA
jgi:hypothetical protein